MISFAPRLARRLALTALLLFSLLATHAPAHANTRVLEALPVTITYEPRDTRVAEKVARICQDEAPRLAAELGLTRIQPIEIVVTRDVRGASTSRAHQLPEWGIAFALLDEQRILVDVNRATSAFNSLSEVVPHELSHLMLRQRVAHAEFPIWFNEGLAQWQSGEWSMVDAWRLMQDVWEGTTPRLADLSSSYPSGEASAQTGYRMAYAAFTDLFAGVGYESLPSFLNEVDQAGDFRRGFEHHFGFTVDDYAAWFHDELEKRYSSNALAFQSGPLLGFSALLFIAVLIRQGIKRRRKFAQLDE